MRRERPLIVLVGGYRPPKLGVGVFLDGMIPALAGALQDRGFEVEFWTNPTLSDSWGKTNEAPTRRVVPALERGSTRYAYNLIALPFELRRAKAAAVVFANDPILGFGLPTSVAVIHDLNELAVDQKYGRLRTGPRTMALRRALATASGIVVSSEHGFAALRAASCDAAERATIVRPGVDLPAMSPTEREPILLSVGRIDPVGKNLDAVVNVHDRLKSVQPATRLVMVGGFNPSTQASGEAFLRAIEDRSDIDYLGYVSDDELEALYRRAQATVFMSRHEGFGYPIAESLAHGTPVVVSEANLAARDFGETGLITIDENRLESDADLPSEILGAIRSSDPAELRAVAETHSWSRAGRNYADAVVRILRGTTE